jgi:hypothetical protein
MVTKRATQPRVHVNTAAASTQIPPLASREKKPCARALLVLLNLYQLCDDLCMRLMAWFWSNGGKKLVEINTTPKTCEDLIAKIGK